MLRQLLPWSQGVGADSLTSSAGRGFCQPRQPSNIPSPEQPRWHHLGGFWLCQLTQPCRVCWASALSTGGCDVQPVTHLCHRTCRPSRCDRYTAKAGGMSRGDTPAYARTPRSTRPPSLGRTCRRTGHGSMTKPKQGLRKKLAACSAGLPQIQRHLKTLPKPTMNLLAPSSRGDQYWHLIFPRKRADRAGQTHPLQPGRVRAQKRSSAASLLLPTSQCSPPANRSVHTTALAQQLLRLPHRTATDGQRKVSSLTLNSLRERDKRPLRPACFIAPICIITCVIFHLKCTVIQLRNLACHGWSMEWTSQPAHKGSVKGKPAARIKPSGPRRAGQC